jgi:hypothetical protein
MQRINILPIKSPTFTMMRAPPTIPHHPGGVAGAAADTAQPHEPVAGRAAGAHAHHPLSAHAHHVAEKSALREHRDGTAPIALPTAAGSIEAPGLRTCEETFSKPHRAFSAHADAEHAKQQRLEQLAEGKAPSSSAGSAP